MNKIIILFILMIASTICYSQDKFYNVIQSDIVRHKCDTGFYYTRENIKCYKSKLRKDFRKETLEISTDSLNIKLYILRKSDSQKKHAGYSAFAAKKNQLYFIKESYYNNYYLIVKPVRMNQFPYSDLGGFGVELIITDKQVTCENEINLIVCYKNK